MTCVLALDFGSLPWLGKLCLSTSLDRLQASFFIHANGVRILKMVKIRRVSVSLADCLNFSGKDFLVFFSRKTPVFTMVWPVLDAEDYSLTRQTGWTVNRPAAVCTNTLGFYYELNITLIHPIDRNFRRRFLNPVNRTSKPLFSHFRLLTKLRCRSDSRVDRCC